MPIENLSSDDDYGSLTITIKPGHGVRIGNVLVERVADYPHHKLRILAPRSVDIRRLKPEEVKRVR